VPPTSNITIHTRSCVLHRCYIRRQLDCHTVDIGRKVSDVIINWWKLIGQRGIEVKSEDLKMRQVLALSSGRHIIMHENCLTFSPLLLGACEQQRPGQKGIKMYEPSVKRL